MTTMYIRSSSEFRTNTLDALYGHAMKITDIDRMTRRICETTRRTRGKMGTSGLSHFESTEQRW